MRKDLYGIIVDTDAPVSTMIENMFAAVVNIKGHGTQYQREKVLIYISEMVEETLSEIEDSCGSKYCLELYNVLYKRYTLISSVGIYPTLILISEMLFIGTQIAIKNSVQAEK